MLKLFFLICYLYSVFFFCHLLAGLSMLPLFKRDAYEKEGKENIVHDKFLEFERQESKI